MKVLLATLIFVGLLISDTALAQSNTDSCHVYVIDVKATQDFREKTDFEAFKKKSKQEQEAIMKAAGIGKTFDEFATKVGEEVLTTKSYPFPKGKYIITSSIYYTDESMASTNHQDSMLVGISVGSKALDNAMNGDDAAVAEVSYNDNTDVVRVKKNVLLDGRFYVIGLECRCKK